MRRDFVNIHDVVKANLLVLNNSKSDFETFNIGGGKDITIKDFCKEVAKAYDKENLELNIPGLYRFGDTRNACSDISKIKALGWNPQNDINYSINSYKDYMLNSDIDGSILEESIKVMKKLKCNKEGNVIISKTPLRISFAGGGSDLPSYYKKFLDK